MYKINLFKYKDCLQILLWQIYGKIWNRQIDKCVVVFLVLFFFNGFLKPLQCLNTIHCLFLLFKEWKMWFEAYECSDHLIRSYSCIFGEIRKHLHTDSIQGDVHRQTAKKHPAKTKKFNPLLEEKHWGMCTMRVNVYITVLYTSNDLTIQMHPFSTLNAIYCTIRYCINMPN